MTAMQQIFPILANRLVKADKTLLIQLSLQLPFSPSISVTCPNGDDPETENQDYEEQTILCRADGGKVRLSFRGQTTYSLPYSASALQVATYFSKLKT